MEVPGRRQGRALSPSTAYLQTACGGRPKGGDVDCQWLGAAGMTSTYCTADRVMTDMTTCDLAPVTACPADQVKAEKRDAHESLH